MKRKLLIFAISMVFSAGLLAQSDRVVPNKPYSSLSSNPGYVTRNEFIGGIGLANTDVDFSKSFFGIISTHSYQIDKSFVVGGGTGALFYNGGTLVPLLADVRYTFRIARIAPYVYGDGGFLLNFSDLNAGTRMFLNPGVGARYSISDKVAANFGLGLWVQMGSGTERSSFINFKTGITFKPR